MPRPPVWCVAATLIAACSPFSSAATTESGATDGGDGAAGPSEGRVRFRGAVAEVASAGAATDLVAPLPSGVQPGDLLWGTLVLRAQASAVPFFPSQQWVKVETRETVCEAAVPRLHTVLHFYRVATGAEPRSIVLGRTSAFVRGDVVVAAFTGVDTSQPLAAHALADLRSGPLSSPALTSDVDDGLLLLSFTLMNAGQAQWEPADGVTLRGSLPAIGLYDKSVGRGVVAPVVTRSTGAPVCGASALAAILRAAP